MAIFRQMGVNETLFIMMGVFVITYLFSSLIALRRARDIVVERHKRTEGREHDILELQEQSGALTAELDIKLKAMAEEHTRTFAMSRAKAADEQKQILGEARDKALSQVGEARAKVQQQVNAEAEKLRREIPELARMILSRFMAPAAAKKNTTHSTQSEA